MFVHLWEAYLGIEPHFDLFQHLFHLKPQPSAINIDIVGGAGLQLCQGLGVKYIPYKLSSKVIDWKDFWFYIENQAPALPARTPGPPVPKPSWNSMSENLIQINDLLDEIDHLKKKKLTGASVVANWMCRQIQPLQQQTNFGFVYTSEDDPSRFTPDKITQADALWRVCRVLDGVDEAPVCGGDFCLNKRPER